MEQKLFASIVSWILMARLSNNQHDIFKWNNWMLSVGVQKQFDFKNCRNKCLDLKLSTSLYTFYLFDYQLEPLLVLLNWVA